MTRRLLALAALGLLALPAAGHAAVPGKPTKLEAIPNYTSPNRIELTWKRTGANETAFDIHRKIGAGGTYTLLDTTAAGVQTYNDISVDIVEDYFYKVRARNADGASDFTAEVRQNVKTIWPVPDSHEILHGWNDTIGRAANPNGFHEGVDIQRDGAKNKVVAARGGRISRAAEKTTEAVANVKVKVGTALHYIQTNHLKNLKVATNDIVYAGQELGEISTVHFDQDFVDHTHYFIHDGAATADALPIHPLSIFSADGDKDPKQKNPVRSHHDGTPAGTFLIREKDETGAVYLPQPIEKDVDLIAEMIDELGTNPDQLPTRIAWWIKAPTNLPACVAAKNVKSAAEPYVLYSWEARYYGASQANRNRANAIADTMQDHGKKIEEGTEKYPWPNYKHYILTNTKGTNGLPDSVDAAQYWNTNAKEDGQAPTVRYANYAGKADAAKPTEARFPDGNYEVIILASDLIHANVAVRPETIRVENFCPIVCECIPSGTFPSGTGETCGFVTFSEAMDTTIAASSLVSIDNGAVLGNAMWSADGFTITYCIDGLEDDFTYTITVSSNAKDKPPAPGGKNLDGDNDGTCGDDFTQEFSVEPTTDVTGLSLFSAAGSDAGIALDWVVRSRDDYLGFYVQRSEGGRGFERQNAEMIPNAADAFPATFRWVDATAREGIAYDYRIEVVHPDGVPEAWDVTAAATRPARAPLAFSLRMTGPNLVRTGSAARFEYAVPMPGSPVSIGVYDTSGRRIASLVEGRVGPGVRSGAWDLTRGGDAVSGVYFLRMEAGSFHATRRVVVIR